MQLKKLAIITSHPIQYNAPLFKMLSQRKNLNLKVFYTWSQAKDKVFDPGFGKERIWDIPLVEGYDHLFVENIAKQPSSQHFRGIINPSLINEIINYNPDFLLVYGWSFQSHLKVIRYFHKKVPIIFRGDSTLLNEQFGLRKFVRTLFLKWVYQHIDFALYVGTENRLYFVRHGLQNHQLVFAPHAIDNERFASNSKENEKEAKVWRKTINIHSDEFVILYAGKMESVKNPQFIIDIASNFKSYPIKFVLVGNGHLEMELKERVKGNNQFVFLGFQNQTKMPIVYRIADIFILPSKSETWGLAVNEAMACGRPVLVSNKCGCAVDLVKNDINGYIFNVNNKVDLIDKVIKLVTNQSRLERMKEESVRIIQKWSFKNICESIEKLVC